MKMSAASSAPPPPPSAKVDKRKLFPLHEQFLGDLLDSTADNDNEEGEEEGDEEASQISQSVDFLQLIDRLATPSDVPFTFSFSSAPSPARSPSPLSSSLSPSLNSQRQRQRHGHSSDVTANEEEEEEEYENSTTAAIAESSALVNHKQHNNQNNSKPKPKRRPPAYKLLPIAPRFLKNDIRRQYANMYANVLNSFDSDLLLSFFGTFLSRSAVMRNEIRPLPSPPGSLREQQEQQQCIHTADHSLQIEGKDMISCFLLATRQLSPDIVCRVESTHIITRSDTNTSELKCKFFVKGNLLYDLPVEMVVEKVATVCDRVRTTNWSEESAAAVTKRVRTNRRRVGSNVNSNSNSNSIQSSDQTQSSGQPATTGTTTAGEGDEGEGDEEEDGDEASTQAQAAMLLDPVAYVKSQFDPCQVYTNLQGMYAPLLARPVQLDLSGIVTFGIDEHKRIQYLEFIRTEDSSMPETPARKE
jgi:hypothetical protein